ncbi:MAG TPA: hypothetical protein HPP66_01320 [Planctomycetes bacterium]|nr:hypothetical protein [Planctomycetota bacterium]
MPDHTAYSVRANLIIVENLITAKIQTGHSAPQMGKTLEFEQACGMRILRRGIWLWERLDVLESDGVLWYYVVSKDAGTLSMRASGKIQADM